MTILSSFLRYHFWIRDFFQGGKIRSHYMNVRYLQEHGEQTQFLRQRMLTDLLRHAMKNTRFYKNINSLELKDFPVVNKSVLQEHYDEIFIPEEENPWQYSGKYHIQRTSGSTGTPFAVPFDTRKRERRLAELKYFGEIVGFKSHDKLVQLRIWTKWQSKSKGCLLYTSPSPRD